MVKRSEIALPAYVGSSVCSFQHRPALHALQCLLQDVPHIICASAVALASSLPSLAVALCIEVLLHWLEDEWAAVTSAEQEPFCELLELDLEHFVLAGPKCSSTWQKLSPAAPLPSAEMSVKVKLGNRRNYFQGRKEVKKKGC